MSKNIDDKTVKILLRTGLGIYLYADAAVVDLIKSNPKFLRFKDDANDSIFLSIEDIVGFEVLDERNDTVPIQDAEVPSSL